MPAPQAVAKAKDQPVDVGEGAPVAKAAIAEQPVHVGKAAPVAKPAIAEQPACVGGPVDAGKAAPVPKPADVGKAVPAQPVVGRVIPKEVHCTDPPIYLRQPSVPFEQVRHWLHESWTPEMWLRSGKHHAPCHRGSSSCCQ